LFGQRFDEELKRLDNTANMTPSWTKTWRSLNCLLKIDEPPINILFSSSSMTFLYVVREIIEVEDWWTDKKVLYTFITLSY
jgi:hypothetical protein